MRIGESRRRFLKMTGAPVLLGLGDLGFMSALGPVSAAAAEPAQGTVQ